MTTKHAFIKQLKGITFAGKADSNHWVTMDGPAGFVAISHAYRIEPVRAAV